MALDQLSSTFFTSVRSIPQHHFPSILPSPQQLNLPRPLHSSNMYSKTPLPSSPNTSNSALIDTAGFLFDPLFQFPTINAGAMYLDTPFIRSASYPFMRNPSPISTALVSTLKHQSRKDYIASLGRLGAH